MGDTEIFRKHIEIKDYGSGPAARIYGSRIRVMDIIAYHLRQGISVDELLEGFPQLSRADIYAALAYYYDNMDEIEAEFTADREIEEKYPKDITTPLQLKLAQRQHGRS